MSSRHQELLHKSAQIKTALYETFTIIQQTQVKLHQVYTEHSNSSTMSCKDTNKIPTNILRKYNSKSSKVSKPVSREVKNPSSGGFLPTELTERVLCHFSVLLQIAVGTLIRRSLDTLHQIFCQRPLLIQEVGGVTTPTLTTPTNLPINILVTAPSNLQLAEVTTPTNLQSNNATLTTPSNDITTPTNLVGVTTLVNQRVGGVTTPIGVKLKVLVKLSIPNVTLEPSLYDIYGVMNGLLVCIAELMNEVSPWGGEREGEEEERVEMDRELVVDKVHEIKQNMKKYFEGNSFNIFTCTCAILCKLSLHALVNRYTVHL